MNKRYTKNKIHTSPTPSQIKRLFVVSYLRLNESKEQNLTKLESIMTECCLLAKERQLVIDWFERAWKNSAWEW